MKKSFFMSILLLTPVVVILKLHSSEQNNLHIGHIDTIALMKSIEEEGYNTIYQAVKNRNFHSLGIHFRDNGAAIFGNRSTPFIIAHTCLRNTHTDFSQSVFELVDDPLKRSFTTISNHYHNAISDCSAYLIEDDNTVTVITQFYNKKKLLKILERIKSRAAKEQGQIELRKDSCIRKQTRSQRRTNRL